MTLQLRQLYKKVDKTVATEVKKLATPVILSNISRTMMSFVDVMMVGHLGSKALAATGMGSMVVWTIISFSIGLRTATQTVSSRRLGQTNYTNVALLYAEGFCCLCAMLFRCPFLALRILSK